MQHAIDLLLSTSKPLPEPCRPRSIALRWMPQKTFDNQSTLVLVMAWCHQATSHYLNQCWPWSMSPYGLTKLKGVNSMGNISDFVKVYVSRFFESHSHMAMSQRSPQLCSNGILCYNCGCHNHVYNSGSTFKNKMERKINIWDFITVPKFPYFVPERRSIIRQYELFDFVWKF